MIRQPDVDLAALDAYTAGVRRAVDEYAVYPDTTVAPPVDEHRYTCPGCGTKTRRRDRCRRCLGRSS